MTRYTVTEADGTGLRYEGFDYYKANKMVASYGKAGIDLYVNEEDLDRDYDEDSYDEHDGIVDVHYYEDDELTSLWGDKKAIKNAMINRIEEDYETEVINKNELHVVYNDPGDSGSDANFHMEGVKLAY